MTFLLWILAVILVIAGIVALTRQAVPLGHRPHHRRLPRRAGRCLRLHVRGRYGRRRARRRADRDRGRPRRRRRRADRGVPRRSVDVLGVPGPGAAAAPPRGAVGLHGPRGLPPVRRLHASCPAATVPTPRRCGWRRARSSTTRSGRPRGHAFAVALEYDLDRLSSLAERHGGPPPRRAALVPAGDRRVTAAPGRSARQRPPRPHARHRRRVAARPPTSKPRAPARASSTSVSGSSSPASSRPPAVRRSGRCGASPA